MLNFVKSIFFCIYWNDHVILSFVLLMWYIPLIELQILNHPCIPAINPTGSSCTILSSILLNSVLLVFCWGFLYIYIHQRYWPVILLFFCSVFISEKAMATHSGTLAQKIPWMEEPGRLQSKGSWRVGHDWAASLPLFTFMEKEMATHSNVLPGESQGQRSLVGCHLWGRTELDTTEAT